jgi:predicted transcriptional regulator
MRRSKLEMYMDILKVIAHRGSVKLTHIMYKANLNYIVLQSSMLFLMNQGMIEEKNVEKQRTAYTITDRGITVLRYFREIEKLDPQRQNFLF